MAVDLTSPYYPYEKIQTGYITLKGAERIPHKLITYLLDLPDKNGYAPIDDNSYPRVRLAKYIWYDGANPLSNPLPTPEQKMSMLFDGNHPDINTDELKALHPKGYRLYPQQYWGQAQTVAQTILKCYIGRVLPDNELSAEIGIYFDILCNVNYQTTTKTDAYERSFDIEQCIVEALHGVNIAGIGVMNYSRYTHSYNGSTTITDTQGTNIGRQVHMSIAWAGGSKGQTTIWDNN